MDYLPVSLLTKVGLNASNITTSDSIIVTSVVLTQLVTQLVTQSSEMTLKNVKFAILIFLKPFSHFRDFTVLLRQRAPCTQHTAQIGP